jgi:hypothetical protein
MTQAPAEYFSPPFKNAHTALVFAFNFSGQHYDRPLMSRMADRFAGSGKGLVGLDGAAQAGMVRAEVKALGRLNEAIITARFAPRAIPCNCGAPCCSGKRQNTEWTNAVAWLSDHMRKTALAGCVSNAVLRREYVARYFTKKEARASLDDVAARHGIHRNTVAAHAAKVVAFLAGTRHGKDFTPGLEEVAMDAISERLMYSRMTLR